MTGGETQTVRAAEWRARDIRVDDPQLEEALLAYLEERGCVVEEVDGYTLRVGAPPSTRSDRAAVVVAGWLDEWRTWHPGAIVYVEKEDAGAD
jgi:hypothetical protein